MSETTAQELQLDERAQQLLRMLVERYIRDGQPVGSRTLSRETGLQLSPATIRNVMSDLEELGLLHSPHTSAGRVPTAQGYRLFIDTMLTVKPLQDKTLREVKQQLLPGQESKALIKSASNVLSEITKLAGIVLIPKRAEASIRHIEFLPLTERRVLAILVVNEKEVQNHIIHTERDYTESELQQAANYLNEHFTGKNISAMSDALRRDMLQTREDFRSLMELVIKMAGDILSSTAQEELLVDGQINLMEFADLSDLDKLKQLFEALNKKRDILHLLDRCQKTESMQIYIGQESGYDVLRECSVITSPYSLEGEVIGVLGVIGPTRMAYDQVIPIVDITAKLLSAALNPKHY